MTASLLSDARESATLREALTPTGRASHNAWSDGAAGAERLARSLEAVLERAVRARAGFPFGSASTVDVEVSVGAEPNFVTATGIEACIFRLPFAPPTAELKRTPLTLRLWIAPSAWKARALYAALHSKVWAEVEGEWSARLAEPRYEYIDLHGLPHGDAFRYRHNYVFNKTPVEGDGNTADDRIGFILGNIVADAGTHSYRSATFGAATHWLKVGLDERDEREVRSLLRALLAHFGEENSDNN